MLFFKNKYIIDCNMTYVANYDLWYKSIENKKLNVLKHIIRRLNMKINLNSEQDIKHFTDGFYKKYNFKYKDIISVDGTEIYTVWNKNLKCDFPYTLTWLYGTIRDNSVEYNEFELNSVYLKIYNGLLTHLGRKTLNELLNDNILDVDFSVLPSPFDELAVAFRMTDINKTYNCFSSYASKPAMSYQNEFNNYPMSEKFRRAIPTGGKIDRFNRYINDKFDFNPEFHVVFQYTDDKEILLISSVGFNFLTTVSDLADNIGIAPKKLYELLDAFYNNDRKTQQEIMSN